jgi:hypothetical protein
MAVSMRWKLLAATAAALTLAFGACGDDEKKGDNENKGSGDGGGLEDFLDGGLESLLADLDDDVAGAPCKENTDCGGKNATCSVGAPGVFRSCTGLCTEDSHCGAGGTCVKIASFGEDQLSYCSKVCSSDSECSSELQCRKGIDINEVVSGISELLDGGIGLEPEETPKICQEKANTVMLANGAVGKPCTADTAASVCGGGTCSTLLNPGGYCTGSCLDDSHCGNTGGCARDIVSATLGAPGTCLLKCTTDTACREGYSCQENAAVFGTGKYCAADIQIPDGGFFPIPDAGATSDSATPVPDAATEDDAGT